ncbi:hypothetical protein L596_004020 [Steinernema carpocapsae]|uniref:Uncharacterized protein n=1 Tax=Steinernema carpocapsae TaxID=34508 RepID=A0A4U8UUF2_STECR|nr:hypothetical protein L596_004020 [Steinernema carpocapsae]
MKKLLEERRKEGLCILDIEMEPNRRAEDALWKGFQAGDREGQLCICNVNEETRKILQEGALGREDQRHSWRQGCYTNRRGDKDWRKTQRTLGNITSGNDEATQIYHMSLKPRRGGQRGEKLDENQARSPVSRLENILPRSRQKALHSTR